MKKKEHRTLRKVYVCGKCGAPHHNARTCGRAAPPLPALPVREMDMVPPPAFTWQDGSVSGEHVGDNNGMYTADELLTLWSLHTLPSTSSTSPTREAHTLTEFLTSVHPVTSPLAVCEFLQSYLDDGGGTEEHKDDRVDILAMVFRVHSFHPEVLHHYAMVKSSRIQVAVADNPRTPPATLELLAQRSSWFDVRAAVGRNPHTPPHVLHLLATSSAPVLGDIASPEVEAVAGNPATPPETLHIIAELGAPLVNYRVSQNPSTAPSTLLALILTSDNAKVLLNVASHPRTPPEGFANLARSTHPPVRVAVATNPSTPPPILAKLAHDTHPDVQFAAQRNPSASRWGQ